MQQQEIIEDPGFAPSFSCYSHDSITSRAVAKAINDENEVNVDDKDFEFSLGNLFIGEREEFSSLEADELDSPPSGTYCEWMPKADITKCKKSNSTGSGSKKGMFWYLLRRSNSEGKESMVLKKVDSPKQKRNLGEVTKVGGRWKAQTPVHEQFYVQRRAENEVEKRRSYLPYRKDLVGLFAKGNGMGKMLPF
ncbi:hypothetical protein HanIR_Chr17g0866521 [Helianthus annuus]|nr:hypothetical protein HanIR_Chr17g0866521 [Helianthus annuus]